MTNLKKTSSLITAILSLPIVLAQVPAFTDFFTTISIKVWELVTNTYSVYFLTFIFFFVLLFGIFSAYWEFTYFASAYLIISPFFRALGAVAIFSLFMKISWTKSAATMFTSYMAMSNMSSIAGNKLAGSLNNYVSNDIAFIVAGGLAAIPLILLIGINADRQPFVIVKNKYD